MLIPYLPSFSRSTCWTERHSLGATEDAGAGGKRAREVLPPQAVGAAVTDSVSSFVMDMLSIFAERASTAPEAFLPLDGRGG